jgi:hypothetical protein
LANFCVVFLSMLCFVSLCRLCCFSFFSVCVSPSLALVINSTVLAVFDRNFFSSTDLLSEFLAPLTKSGLGVENSILLSYFEWFDIMTLGSSLSSESSSTQSANSGSSSTAFDGILGEKAEPLGLSKWVGYMSRDLTPCSFSTMMDDFVVNIFRSLKVPDIVIFSSDRNWLPLKVAAIRLRLKQAVVQQPDCKGRLGSLNRNGLASTLLTV